MWHNVLILPYSKIINVRISELYYNFEERRDDEEGFTIGIHRIPSKRILLDPKFSNIIKQSKHNILFIPECIVNAFFSARFSFENINYLPINILTNDSFPTTIADLYYKFLLNSQRKIQNDIKKLAENIDCIIEKTNTSNFSQAFSDSYFLQFDPFNIARKGTISEVSLQYSEYKKKHETHLKNQNLKYGNNKETNEIEEISSDAKESKYLKKFKKNKVEAEERAKKEAEEKASKESLEKERQLAILKEETEIRRKKEEAINQAELLEKKRIEEQQRIENDEITQKELEEKVLKEAKELKQQLTSLNAESDKRRKDAKEKEWQLALLKAETDKRKKEEEAKKQAELLEKRRIEEQQRIEAKELAQKALVEKAIKEAKNFKQQLTSLNAESKKRSEEGLFKKIFSPIRIKLNFIKELAIIIDESNTKIIYNDKLVVDEPSIVAIDMISGKMIAVGTLARQMHGKTYNNIRTIRPYRGGVVADFNAAELMIRGMIKKINLKHRLFSLSYKIVATIPSGSTEVEMKAMRNSLEHVGGQYIYFIYEIMAAAIGVGIDVEELRASMLVHIGRDTTEFAVIALGGIVSNKTIRTAGDVFSAEIQMHMRHVHNMKIGERTAENIKINVGSCLEVLENPPEDFVVKGPNLMTAMPIEIPISYQEIALCLDKSISKIETTILRVLKQTPHELYANIVNDGIYLVGGGSLIRGLEKRLTDKIGIPFHLTEDPRYAIVRGTGISLKNVNKFTFLMR